MRPLPLLCALLGLLCAGCGAAPPQRSLARERGEELYASWNCGACHGEARQGTEFGPPLTELARVWDLPALTAHLADPERARTADPRVRALATRFPAPMPAYPEKEGDRRELAAWLLAGKAAS